MRIITCFGDRTCGTFLILLDDDSSVSQTDNFVNVFNSAFCTNFLTMSVGFHFNLTFGLKPEVGGIKIVCHCLQTIHFPS